MEENTDFLDYKVERETFLSQLNESRKAEELTDVKLKVGDELFPAHRNVLFHSSPVLKALISDQSTKVFPLSEQYVNSEIMENLLSFLYTGSIDLTPDNAHPICVAAHFLQIPTLLEPSVKYLCQVITIENVFTLFKFSISSELEELDYSCLKFVNNNHESVFQSSQILELPSKEFQNLIAGLKKFWNKMLRENTFHAIVRWTEKNVSERLNEFPVLLKNIPLEELPLEFLTETVSNHPLVEESISGIETVTAALANYRTYSTDSTPLWKTNQNMIVLGEAENQRAVRLYDSRSGLWRELPVIPSKRKFCGVTVAKHQDIILCGGCEGEYHGTPTTSVVMFNWSTQTWTELPRMPMFCANATAAICNDDLYVHGVFKADVWPRKPDHTKEVFRYHFDTKVWKFVASLNEEQAEFLVEHKNHLYAFGGRSMAVEKYDPAQDKWTIMTRMQNCVINTVTVHESRIYMHCSSGFQVYDPETNSFDTFPKPPLEHTSLVSLNGKLLAVGGLQKKREKSHFIYELDFTAGKWIEFCKMDFALAFNCTVVGAFH